MSNTLTQDDYLKLLGKFVVDFSSFESWNLLNAVSQLIGDTAIGYQVATAMNFMELDNLFRSLFLYRVTDETLTSRCQSVYKSIEKMNIDRNTILHSSYQIGEFGGRLYLRSREKFSKRTSNGLTLESESDFYPTVEKAIKKIATVSTNLSTLMKDSEPLITEHIKTAAKNRIYFNEIKSNGTNTKTYKAASQARKNPKT
jgi:hypothetical protein